MGSDVERICEFRIDRLSLLESDKEQRFKALALGADFVQLGRPILWGLAHEGEKGARHVLRSLLADFDLTVGLSGCRGLSDIDRSCLATEDGEELKAYNRD